MSQSQPREEDHHNLPLPAQKPSSFASAATSLHHSSSTTPILFSGGSRNGIYISISHHRKQDDRLVISWCTSSPRLLVPHKPNDPSTMKFEDHPSQEMLDGYVDDMLRKAFSCASMRTLLSVRRLAHTAPLPLFIELLDATNCHQNVEKEENEYSYMHVALFLSTLKSIEYALPNKSMKQLNINFIGCSFKKCNLTDRDVATLLNGLNGQVNEWAEQIRREQLQHQHQKSSYSSFPLGCWPLHSADMPPTPIEFDFSGNNNISLTTSPPQLLKGLAHFAASLAPPEAEVKKGMLISLRFTQHSELQQQVIGTSQLKAACDMLSHRSGMQLQVQIFRQDENEQEYQSNPVEYCYSDPQEVAVAMKRKQREQQQQDRDESGNHNMNSQTPTQKSSASRLIAGVPQNVQQLLDSRRSAEREQEAMKQQKRQESIERHYQEQHLLHQAALSFFSLYELISRQMNLYLTEAQERTVLVTNWCQSIGETLSSSAGLGLSSPNNSKTEKEEQAQKDVSNIASEIRESLSLQTQLLSSLRFHIDMNSTIPLWRSEDFDESFLPLLAQSAAVVIQNHAVARPNHLVQIMTNIKKCLLRDQWCGMDYALVESTVSSSSSSISPNFMKFNLESLSNVCSDIFSLWSNSAANPAVVVDKSFDVAERILLLVDPWLKTVSVKSEKLLLETYGLMQGHFALLHQRRVMTLMLAEQEKSRRKQQEMLQQQQMMQQRAKEEQEKERRRKEEIEFEQERRKRENARLKAMMEEAERWRSTTASPEDVRRRQNRESTRSASAHQQSQDRDITNSTKKSEERHDHDQDPATKRSSSQKPKSSATTNTKPLPPWGSAFAGKISKNNSRSNSPTPAVANNSNETEEHQKEQHQKKKRELTKPSVRDFIAQHSRDNNLKKKAASSSCSRSASSANTTSSTAAPSRSSSSFKNQEQEEDLAAMNLFAMKQKMKPDWVEVNTEQGRKRSTRSSSEANKATKTKTRQHQDHDDDDDDDDRQHGSTRKIEEQDDDEAIIFTRQREEEARKLAKLLHEKELEKERRRRELFEEKRRKERQRQKELEELEEQRKREEEMEQEAREREERLDRARKQVRRDNWKSQQNKVDHENKNSDEDNHLSPTSLYDTNPPQKVLSSTKSKPTRQQQHSLSPQAKPPAATILSDDDDDENDSTQQRHHQGSTKKKHEDVLSSIESLLSEALLQASKSDPQLTSSAVSPKRLLKALLKVTNNDSSSSSSSSPSSASVLHESSTSRRAPSTNALRNRHPSIANVVNGGCWNHDDQKQQETNTNDNNNNNYYFTPPRFALRNQQRNNITSSSFPQTSFPQTSYHYQQQQQQRYFDPHQQQENTDLSSASASSLSLSQQYEMMKNNTNKSKSLPVNSSSSASSSSLSKPAHTLAAEVNRDRYANARSTTFNDHHSQQQYHDIFATQSQQKQTHTIPVVANYRSDSSQQQRTEQSTQNRDQEQFQNTHTHNHQHNLHHNSVVSYGGTSCGSTANQLLKSLRNFAEHSRNNNNNNSNTSSSPQSSKNGNNDNLLDPFGTDAKRKQDEVRKQSLQIHNEILDHLRVITPSLREEAEKRARALLSDLSP